MMRLNFGAIIRDDLTDLPWELLRIDPVKKDQLLRVGLEQSRLIKERNLRVVRASPHWKPACNTRMHSGPT